MRDVLPRRRLPHAQRQRGLLLELLPQADRAEPAVLVVMAGDAARGRDLHPLAHRVDHLVGRVRAVAVLEPPRGLLAQDSRRLAVLVALDDATLDVELAAGERERRAVEPERVVV